MAVSWLSLARRDEATDNLLASWDTAEPVKTDGLVLSFRSTNLLLGEPAIGRHRDEKAVRRKSRTASSFSDSVSLMSRFPLTNDPARQFELKQLPC